MLGKLTAKSTDFTSLEIFHTAYAVLSACTYTRIKFSNQIFSRKGMI